MLTHPQTKTFQDKQTDKTTMTKTVTKKRANVKRESERGGGRSGMLKKGARFFMKVETQAVFLKVTSEGKRK